MNLRYFVLIYAIAFLLPACKDEPVEILSLSKNGERYYFGEQVVLWTAVDADKSKVSYDWECTGGSFNNGPLYQHLRENCWIAPSEPGEYFVTVNVKTKNNSDTRRVRMLVTNYYRYGFEGPLGTGQGQDRWAFNTSEGALGTYNGQSVAFFPSTSNTADGYFGRNNFTSTGATGGSSIDPPLVPPFSIQTKMMYAKYRANATNVTTAGHATQFRFQFVQPGNVYDKPYIREIRLEFIPAAHPDMVNNWRLRFERFTTNLNQSVWSSTTPAANEPGALYPDAIQGYDPIFNLDALQFHTFTFTMDTEKRLTIWINGQKWVDGSNAINSYLAANGLNQSMQVSWFRVYAPRNESAANTTLASAETLWVLSDFIVNNAKSAIGGNVDNIGFEDLK